MGQITLDFLPVTTGNAVLTVTGKNLALTTVNLPVTAGSAYLALDYAMSAEDDGTAGSSGNGNGAVEAGETIALTAVLEETGGAGTPTRTGVLTTTTPGVTIVTGTASFPATCAGGFHRGPDSLPGQHSIRRLPTARQGRIPGRRGRRAGELSLGVDADRQRSRTRGVCPRLGR